MPNVRCGRALLVAWHSLLCCDSCQPEQIHILPDCLSAPQMHCHLDTQLAAGYSPTQPDAVHMARAGTTVPGTAAGGPPFCPLGFTCVIVANMPTPQVASRIKRDVTSSAGGGMRRRRTSWGRRGSPNVAAYGARPQTHPRQDTRLMPKHHYHAMNLQCGILQTTRRYISTLALIYTACLTVLAHPPWMPLSAMCCLHQRPSAAFGR